MAPTAPSSKPLSARERRLARIRGDIHPLLPHKTLRPEAQVTDGFLSSKKDKRIMKHSALVSKIQSSSSASSAWKEKRRRPNKKLVATMESLADALPDLEDDENTAEAHVRQMKEGKVRHTSLKSRPGALKRKERVVKGEMARFGASMAALAGIEEGQAQQTRGQGREAGKKAKKAGAAEGMEVENEEGGNNTQGGAQTPAAETTAETTNRWAALRRHISSTMEQNPAFLP